MKISYNPKSSQTAITTETAANDDIIFDLYTSKLWAKGVRIGADWADISSKPSSLKNPAALTTFGVVYDGSVAKTVNPTNFISQVNEAASTITDGTMLITSYASNNGFSDTNAVNIPYKRKASHLWDYIKTKTDALYSAIGHNHDGRYVRYYAVTTLDCNNLGTGLTVASVGAAHAASSNHSAFLYISGVGTPFQIQMPDYGESYIYKRYYSSGKWSGWFKLNAGYADSAGSVAWDNITNKPDTATRWPSWTEVTGKPSSFTPSTHTHGLSNSVFFLNMPSISGNAKWKEVFGYPVNYNLLLSVRINSPAPEWCVGNYGSGILYGGSDTKGFMSSAYNEPLIMWAGGNGSSDDSVPKWYIGIRGTHKSIYNLTTIASEANAAYNLRHSHANKSVLDGITSGLVSNWNTAYTFVSTITGTDTDNVINKWDEIVNFLAGITEDNKLNTLLNSKLSIQQLSAKDILTTKTNNALFWVDTIGTAGSITTGPFTDHPYALLSVTNYNQTTKDGKYFYRSRLAFNSVGDLKVASCHYERKEGQDDTWYNVLTSKNSGISGSTIKLNGTSITVYSSDTADGRYVKKSGDTMTGSLNFANAVWNNVGDDVAIGDHNIAGCLGIKGLNAGPGLAFYNSSNTLLSKLIGTTSQFQRVSGNNVFNILDTSSTYVSNGKGIINGTTITQVDNATNADKLDGYHYNNFTYKKYIDYNRNGPYNIKVFSSNISALTWGSGYLIFDIFSTGYANNRVYFGRYEVSFGHWNNTDKNPTVYSRWIFKTNSAYDCIHVVKDLSNYKVDVYVENNLWDSQMGLSIVAIGAFDMISSNSWVDLPSASSNIEIVNTTYLPFIGNSSSATKLQTARKLWGQSFDGTADVKGTLSGVAHIQFSADNSYSIGTPTSEAAHTYTRQIWARHLNASRVYTGDTNLYIGYSNTAMLRFYSGTKQSGDGSNERMTISTNGNVGIGINTPAHKLQVAGTVYASDKITSAGFKHSAVTKNANQYVLTADGGYTFLNQASNELAHEFDVNITVTSEWTDIKDFYGGNQSFLTQPGTYIVQVYYTTNSANSMYEGYFSGIMSWYTGKTNSNNADEIVLHRVGHAYANTIYLRTRESLSSEENPYTKLQISANSDLKQHTYKFKFKRIC